MQVGRELVAVLAPRGSSAPPLSSSIEGADASRRGNPALHPSPARGSLAEAVEEDDSRSAPSNATHVEPVAVDEVGAAAGRCVARSRGGERLERAADGNEQQDEERRIDERTARPVVKRAACAADRPPDEREKKHRPHPSGKPENAVARGEHEDRYAG